MESDLLHKIDHSLAQIPWVQYCELVAKRQAETLTAKEQEELISLSDQIEEANAGRIETVARLADIRKKSLPVMMKELRLTPVAYR